MKNRIQQVINKDMMARTLPVTSVSDRYSDGKSGSGLFSSLRQGQIIDAITLSDTRDGRIMLRIAGRQALASTSIDLPVDRRLTLKIVQLQPQVLLKFMPGPEAVAAGKPLTAAKLSMLPRQGSMISLLTSLPASSASKDESAAMRAARPLVDSLLKAIPVRSDVMQAGSLRQAMLSSGLFFESGLLNAGLSNSIDVSTDIKALLIRLISALHEAGADSSTNTGVRSRPDQNRLVSELPPPQKQHPVSQPRGLLDTASHSVESALDMAALYKKARGALARLVLHQVATAESFEEGQHEWKLEIPVRQNSEIDVVSIEIKKEHGGADEDEAPSWVINLALDLPRLGSLQVRISLNQTGISSTFWCDLPESAGLVQNRLEMLRSSFKRLGVKTSNISCHAGSPPSCTTTAVSKSLVDQHV